VLEWVANPVVIFRAVCSSPKPAGRRAGSYFRCSGSFRIFLSIVSFCMSLALSISFTISSMNRSPLPYTRSRCIPVGLIVVWLAR
jgi:hypothetical protein